MGGGSGDGQGGPGQTDSTHVVNRVGGGSGSIDLEDRVGGGSGDIVNRVSGWCGDIVNRVNGGNGSTDVELSLIHI